MIFGSESLPNAYTDKVMSFMVYEEVHKFVLMNHPAMLGWMEESNLTSMKTTNM
jgi:hypothetical protein